MNLKEYQKLCDKTASNFSDPEKTIFIWGLGLTGEAGDVAGCIKKTYAHDNDQREGIKENLGDTLWYMAMICNFFKWNMEDILNQNIEKLKARYPKGKFTIEDAKRKGERIDWNEKDDFSMISPEEKAEVDRAVNSMIVKEFKEENNEK